MPQAGEHTILTKDESLKKDFWDMSEMLRVLYEERNSQLQGEGSKSPTKEEGKKNGDKPQSSPQNS